MTKPKAPWASPQKPKISAELVSMVKRIDTLAAVLEGEARDALKCARYQLANAAGQALVEESA